MRVPERHSFSLPAGGFFSACREHVSAGEDAADGAFDHFDAVNGYAALALIVCADAKATTTMESSPRRAACWGEQVSFAALIGRKV